MTDLERPVGVTNYIYQTDVVKIFQLTGFKKNVNNHPYIDRGQTVNQSE